MLLNSGENVPPARKNCSLTITSALRAANAWIAAKEPMLSTSLKKPHTKAAKGIRVWKSFNEEEQPGSRARMRSGLEGPFKSLARWLAKSKTERGVRGKNQTGPRRSERSLK